MVRVSTMTTDEYKANWASFKIIYAFHSTPFGNCLIGVRSVDKAVLHLAFVDEKIENALDILKKDWPLSELVEDAANETKTIIQIIFSQDASIDDSISAVLKGTEFQMKVWESLMLIPKGTRVTYEKVASNMGNPKATRAVANAIMKNNIAYLVPCHRVMGKSGSNKYKWGIKRKENILMYESKQF